MEEEEVESFIIVSSRLIYTKLTAEEGGALFSPLVDSKDLSDSIPFCSILQTS